MPFDVPYDKINWKRIRWMYEMRVLAAQLAVEYGWTLPWYELDDHIQQEFLTKAKNYKRYGGLE